MNKENAYTTVVKNGKSSECKNAGTKKKGLLVNVENRQSTSAAQGSSIANIKFQIYYDGTNGRSRPRARKDVCRKDIRARQDNNALEKTIISTTKAAKDSNSSPDLHASLRRARSSSNCRQTSTAILNKPIMTNNLFCNRRSYSESTRISHYAQNIVQLSEIRKTRHLTDDVKKRTLSSIQMWKDKMRKPHTGAVTKNTASLNVNNRALSQIDINKMHVKTNLKKRYVTGSMDLQSEVSRNRMTNLNKIDEVTPNIDSGLLKYLSSEIATMLQNKYLPAQHNNVHDNKKSSTSENTLNNYLSTTVVISSNSATPLDGPSSLPLTPAKVRHEKQVTQKSSSSIKDNELDIICETPYERDYLEDVPDTERMRENNAPKLSSRFLRDNVNPEQRKLIVGYIIRLGVHCHYSSHIIYQTVKLFNVAIDKILVEMNDIQLMALACLWITLKQEAHSVKIPSATTILQLAKDLYVNQEKCLLIYEKKILSTIKFNIRFADPFSLMSYYILNVNRDSQCNLILPTDIVRLYFCGSYMIDLSMLDENLCDMPACVIAMAAVELALRFVYLSDVNMDQAWCQVWRSKQSLTEWEERMMNTTKRIMIRHALEYEKFSSNIVYKKYLRSKHGKISHFLYDKLKQIIM